MGGERPARVGGVEVGTGDDEVIGSSRDVDVQHVRPAITDRRAGRVVVAAARLRNEVSADRVARTTYEVDARESRRSVRDEDRCDEGLPRRSGRVLADADDAGFVAAGRFAQ